MVLAVPTDPMIFVKIQINKKKIKSLSVPKITVLLSYLMDLPFLWISVFKMRTLAQ